MRHVRSLIRRVSDGRRTADPDVRLDDIAFAAGVHLYALELRPNGTYRTLVTTRLSAMFVGEPPAGVDEDVWYDQHVHADDRARYESMFVEDLARAGGQFEPSYRPGRGHR